MTYSVLVVCTGNICRSPAAQHLLDRALDDSVAVSSAGTRGLPGWPVDERMAAHLRDDGVELGPFRSRPLTGEMMAGADLVLTVTAAHRASALALHPSAVRHTVTLGELSRLAAELPGGSVQGATDAERLAALVPAALALRPRFLGQDGDDDIRDPYGRPDDEYWRSYAWLRRQVGRLVTSLHGGAGAVGTPRPR
ncbi:arsenate-mycothiol transferase ArsC [Isoptericola cucumis]|uniref:Protein-tyrosine-phosphatase n=1 Tax=Isoptericola cucumis TaxID=1776856 RepID=A0ABQ2B3X2_9MICO|nr:low molecular weight phosphatase family protein [Isoptericola cucumis]GGI05630.1 protein-tyrosine-phosphatase [Isoptericola cucumis]